MSSSLKDTSGYGMADVLLSLLIVFILLQSDFPDLLTWRSDLQRQSGDEQPDQHVVVRIQQGQLVDEASRPVTVDELKTKHVNHVLVITNDKNVPSEILPVLDALKKANIGLLWGLESSPDKTMTKE